MPVTAVLARPMLPPTVVVVKFPVGMRIRKPPPVEKSPGAVIVEIAAVPDINVINAVGAMVAALAMVAAAAGVCIALVIVTAVKALLGDVNANPLDGAEIVQFPVLLTVPRWVDAVANARVFAADRYSPLAGMAAPFKVIFAKVACALKMPSRESFPGSP